MLFGRIVFLIYLVGNFVHRKIHIPIIRQLLWAAYNLVHIIIARGICSSEIHGRCTIGKNLILMHGANGVVIHPAVKIGDNVTIYHQVTIGQRDRTGALPIIGSKVTIGAGAKVLGDITIGEGASIGANAVVLSDVPAGATAVGIPAKIITVDVVKIAN